MPITRRAKSLSASERTAATAAGNGIRVVHLAAEYWPFARTGGLAEAVSGLAKFQAASGIPTTVMLPLYGAVREAEPALKPLGPAFEVRVGPRSEEARLWGVDARQARGAPRVLFIEHDGYFDRAGIYGERSGDYPDNARRFAFLCRAALQAVPDVAPAPVILHAHDWHTALAPVYLRTELAGQAPYHGVATVLSVHNAGFQGHFPFETLAEIGLPAALYDPRWLEWYGRANLLKGGLTFTDVATTVSPTHAYELRTEAGGFGLHDTFIALRDRLVGILNGIDPETWNPATDRQVTACYSAANLAGKQRCKAALQRGCGLPVQARTPLFGMSARLVAQKGLDLILGGDVLTTADAQFVFLGTGEERYETALAALAAAAPDRIAVELDFTDQREHRLLAGADVLLMPSLYEPCGLTQMRAQRYGALPLARRVGGLVDTIEDETSGFLFDEYTPAAFGRAVGRALALYRDAAAWETHMREAMARDFGWSRSVAKYLEAYRRAIAVRAASR